MKEQAESQSNVNSPVTNSVGWYYPSAMYAGTVERGSHFIKDENEKRKVYFHYWCDIIERKMGQIHLCTWGKGKKKQLEICSYPTATICKHMCLYFG